MLFLSKKDDILKLIIFVLSKLETMSRKGLVNYIILMLLRKQYSKVPNVCVEQVINLLLNIGCLFTKERDNNKADSSPLIWLNKEYTDYSTVRRLYDTEIIHTALEAGIHMSPETWALKLRSNISFKSEMQSIIDKIQSHRSFQWYIDHLFKKHKIIESFVARSPIGYHLFNLVIELLELAEKFKSNFEAIDSMYSSRRKTSNDSTHSFKSVDTDGSGNSKQFNDYSIDNSPDWIVLDGMLNRLVSVFDAHFKHSILIKKMELMFQENHNINNNNSINAPPPITSQLFNQNGSNYDFHSSFNNISENNNNNSNSNDLF
jgi:hypothetical protein